MNELMKRIINLLYTIYFKLLLVVVNILDLPNIQNPLVYIYNVILIIFD